jgi:hypothetical protein
MYKLKQVAIALVIVASLCLGGPTLDASARPLAATNPDLGIAATFAILANTYTNTVGGTTITGDVGYTTGPAVAPTVNGNTYIVGPTYTAAGAAQGSALTQLNSQPCDYPLVGGTDLSTLTQPLSAGVYCIDGAVSVGGLGITLSDPGTYIFRSAGALTTVAGSVVNGNACNVFWTPVATTLGANSTFVGTVIDDAGITIGSTVIWTGRALAFAETISTDTDTMSVPVCTTATTTTEDEDEGESRRNRRPTVSGLPNTGGAPIREAEFPWVLMVVGGVSAAAIFLGARSFRRKDISRK